MTEAGGTGEPEQRFPPIAVEAILDSSIAAEFLDVNLAGTSGWVEAVGRLAAFKQVDFSDFFYGLRDDILSPDRPADAPRPYRIVDDRTFRNALVQEGREIAGKLRSQARTNWSEADYGPKQVDAAIAGRPVRFDKAVITCLAFNNIAKDFGLDGKWSIGRHSIVACIFWFRDLATMLRRTALAQVSSGGHAIVDSEKKDDRIEQRIVELIDEMANSDEIDQSPETIRRLAGLKPDGQIEADPKHGPYLASFPTQVAILDFLLRKQAEGGATAEMGKERQPRKIKLWEMIVRRETHGPKMLTDPAERVSPASKMTYGPYKWPGSKSLPLEDHWPPKIHAAGFQIVEEMTARSLRAPI